jgi:hypothetical protein
MRDSRLSRALDDCLAAMHKGATPEECLLFHADLRAELRPLLTAATSIRQEERLEMPAGPASFARGQLMRAIAADNGMLGTRQVGQGHLGLKPKAWGPRRLSAGAARLSPRRVASGDSPGYRSSRRLRPLALAPFVIALLIAMLVFAASVSTSPTGTEAATVLSVLQGEVRIERAGDVFTAGGRMLVRPGDRIATSPGGRAVLTFFDGSSVTLGGDTVVVLRSSSDAVDGPRTTLLQLRGSTWTHIPHDLGAGAVEIDTPNARVQTHDASVATTVGPDGGTQVGAQSGKLELSSGGQSTEVHGGQQASVATPGVVGPAVTAGEPERALVVRIRGPVYAFLSDPTGATVGTLDPGVPVNQVPGAAAWREGDELVLRIPDPDAGAYRLGLQAAGNGPVAVVAEVQDGGGAPIASSSFSVASGDNVTVGLGVSDAAVAVGNVEVTDQEITPPPVTVTDRAIDKAKSAPTLAPPAPSATPTRTQSSTPTVTPAASPTPRPSATPQPQKTPVKDFEPVDQTNPGATDLSQPVTTTSSGPTPSARPAPPR